MSISELKKEKLRDLELDRGGVAFAKGRVTPTSTSTIVISLGGLGAKTLNTLKGKFLREIGQCDHIWFRMLDTDESTLKQYYREKPDDTPDNVDNAFMEREEVISLYDPAIVDILDPHKIPYYIDQWLNPSLKGRTLDRYGAQQIRQIGRVMLTTAYDRVRSELNTTIGNAIELAHGDRVNVILITGISGGTGSGILIDFSYMIHDIMKSCAKSNYNLAGYIYMPDAQFSLPDISSSPELKAKLIRNGYAALKEIDYFMDIEEKQELYRLHLINRTVESQKNIFSSCTLISGHNETGDLGSIHTLICSLTDHLLDMLRDFAFHKEYGGMLSVVAMIEELMGVWHIHKSTWFNMHPDRRLYHRYATYEYQVMKYNSIRIPREEIFAYCVDQIFGKMMNEFRKIKIVNTKILKYTAILNEIQNILSKDGNLFTNWKRAQDTIWKNPDCIDRLKYYLDDAISHISVRDFAQVFLKRMEDKKEKWNAMTSESNFDVVHEVRDLMDECLIQNNLAFIEKFIVAAYNSNTLTSDQLDDIWDDNSPDGPKMTALREAAKYILSRLEHGTTTMIPSSGRISLEEYFSFIDVSGLSDTPTLTKILDEYIYERYRTHISVSRSDTRYTYIKIYYGIPLYILKGMKEYHEEYIRNPSPGMHMDERNQNWSRIPNPYTIDSVMLDLLEQDNNI